MARLDAKQLELDILTVLGVRWHPTYVIRNWLLQDAAFSKRWAGIQTSQVLTACKRMKNKGLVRENLPWSSRTSIAWEVTPEGRAKAQVIEQEALHAGP